MIDENLQAELDEAIGGLIRRISKIPVTTVSVMFIESLVPDVWPPMFGAQEDPTGDEKETKNHRVIRFPRRKTR